MNDQFDMAGRTVIVTGGGGLLGPRHAEAVARVGAIPILVDVNREMVEKAAAELTECLGADVLAVETDITDETSVKSLLKFVLSRFGRVDVLINNAANNPKVSQESGPEWSRLESFSLAQWNQDLAVGLTGALICSRVFGSEMARKGRGSIINVASDLSVIAPDQRIYRRSGRKTDCQPVKPVSYSVVKTALIGLTRYLATYWCESQVRVNALSPGGVFTNQGLDFVRNLTRLIPLGRMAELDEYQGAIVFLASDASSYMTGQNLVIDGGRSCW